jgi:ribosomal protein L17
LTKINQDKNNKNKMVELCQLRTGTHEAETAETRETPESLGSLIALANQLIAALEIATTAEQVAELRREYDRLLPLFEAFIEENKQNQSN